MAITAVLPDQVLANGASDGDLLTVQADGSVAFETPAGGGGGIGGSTGATDNAVLRADGTGGSTLQGSSVLIDDSGHLGVPSGSYLCWATGSGLPNTGFSARASGVYSVFRAYSQDCFAISHYGYVNVRANAGYGFTSSTSSVAQHPEILLYRTDSDNLRVSQWASKTVPSAGLQVTHLETYNTYTSATSYERLEIGWDTNVATINTAAGSAGGTKRGLQICSASTDELGFFGATPVDQPATVADPSGGSTVDTEARAAIEAVIDRLQELGLIAT
jgi:hypothetical protein